MPTTTVKITDVTKKFGRSITALDSVSLEVTAGEKVVLLGQSGSGKSTLLRHVNRLHAPTSGELEVLGEPLHRLSSRNVRRVRRDIGVVFQDFHLVGGLTALENVCTGMLGSLWGPRMGLAMYPKAVRRKGIELLERVGIGDRAFQRTDTLSGGQKQRVAIARALIQDPRILLADEPVASLDPESAKAVLELISTISSEMDLTVIMSLHQIEYALSFADRIIGLRDGKIVLDKLAAEIDSDEALTIYRSLGAKADDRDDLTTGNIDSDVAAAALAMEAAQLAEDEKATTTPGRDA